VVVATTLSAPRARPGLKPDVTRRLVEEMVAGYLDRAAVSTLPPLPDPLQAASHRFDEVAGLLSLPVGMPQLLRSTLCSSAGEIALWILSAIYLLRGGFWWHFSVSGAAIVCLRSKRAQRTRARRQIAEKEDASRALADRSDAGQ
jgi:hypothetical protein